MRTVGAVAMSVAALAAMPAHAIDWRFEPSMSGGADYTENPRLIPGFDESYAGYRAELTAALSANSEVGSISLLPRYIYARYADDPLLDRGDTHVTLSGQRQFETVNWTAVGSFTRDSTITSELGLTGLQDVNRDHEALSVSLGPTLQLSERTQAGVQVYGLDSHYEDAEGTGLVDYRYGLVGLSANHVWTETLTLGVQGSIGELDVSSTSFRSRDIDGTVSLDWRFAPHWQAQFELGPTRVESAAEESQGETYAFSLTKQNIRSDLRMAMHRDVTPTGRGVLVTRDRATLSGSYAVTERARWSLAVHGVRTTDALQTAGRQSQTNEYANLETSLRWRVAEHWSLVASATARHARYEFRDDDADGLNVGLGFSWHGQPRTLSR